jgi:hypothetical protein
MDESDIGGEPAAALRLFEGVAARASRNGI